MTPLDHPQIPVTDPVGRQVGDPAGATNFAAVSEIVSYKYAQVAADRTPGSSTPTVPEVVVAAAAEVTQVAVMYPVATLRRLLQVFKTGFLLREFSGR
jgi:hypothetical protein